MFLQEGDTLNQWNQNLSHRLEMSFIPFPGSRHTGEANNHRFRKGISEQDVQDLFKQLKIRHATVEVGDDNALGVIDRFSRTIQEQIFKDFTENYNVIWHDKLPDYMHA